MSTVSSNYQKTVSSFDAKWWLLRELAGALTLAH
jgi:hypothetical protein